MEYVKYDFAIRELYGIQLVGLPSDIKLLRTSLWNLETVLCGAEGRVGLRGEDDED
jgi:hypothetical protein